MKMNDSISHEQLTHLLSYNPASGIFTHAARRYGVTLGRVAGSTDPVSGYVRIKINGIPYLAHRLAWFYIHRLWPQNEIDHEDRNRSNNTFTNLRQATHSQNQQNKPVYRNSSTGIKGVFWHKQHRKYAATIQVDNKPHHLGLFDSIESAAAARREAAPIFHGEFSSTK